MTEQSLWEVAVTALRKIEQPAKVVNEVVKPFDERRFALGLAVSEVVRGVHGNTRVAEVPGHVLPTADVVSVAVDDRHDRSRTGRDPSLEPQPAT